MDGLYAGIAMQDGYVHRGPVASRHPFCRVLCYSKLHPDVEGANCQDIPFDLEQSVLQASYHRRLKSTVQIWSLT
jgi:hypothetical protein